MDDDRTDDEKAVRGTVQVIDLPTDPDAHLSAAERASIVRDSIPKSTNVESHKSQDRKLVWKLDLYLIPWVNWTHDLHEDLT